MEIPICYKENRTVDLHIKTRRDCNRVQPSTDEFLSFDLTVFSFFSALNFLSTLKRKSFIV